MKKPHVLAERFSQFLLVISTRLLLSFLMFIQKVSVLQSARMKSRPLPPRPLLNYQCSWVKMIKFDFKILILLGLLVIASVGESTKLLRLSNQILSVSFNSCKKYRFCDVSWSAFLNRLHFAARYIFTMQCKEENWFKVQKISLQGMFFSLTKYFCIYVVKILSDFTAPTIIEIFFSSLGFFLSFNRCDGRSRF